MKHLYCAVCADSDEIDSFSADPGTVR